MKLGKKISLIAISVILVMMSLVIYLMVQAQANTMRSADEEQTRQALHVLVSNMVSVADFQGEGYRDTTIQSLVQYYFSQYASLVQEKTTYYSLASEGRYLYNLCPYDPMAQMPLEEGEEGTLRITAEQGEPILICGATFSMAGNQFAVYISRDVSGTQQQIVRLQLLGFGLLAVACIVGAAVLVILLKRALQPITRLTKTATAISEGNYQMRTAYTSADEIGQLSKAFDQMADSIEAKVASLDAELERKEMLLGALSHEIRTPMTAVVGYADTLLHMPLDEGQREKCVQQIAEAGRRAEGLTQKMMDMIGLTGQGSARKQEFSTAHLIESLADVYGERVDFTRQIETVYGDETLLYSLLENLIVNALRASEESDRVLVCFRTEGPDCVITVEDHGCGIPAEHIPMLTEPFYRVDKARSRKMGGAGLGLAICQRIVEWHGGTLAIASTVGRGTTVTVRIPTHTT
ncbi:MAG TPA: HAMP domain-containing histidine kinase [Candidatus Faecimorpha stercoravium]|nr:HAMP domain-containing histidine kinase [Candidatus Faecimorpha stercoravium]